MNTPEDDRKSALFTSLVLQQSNMAMMFLGKAPNPETGQATLDLESAGFFIDQLDVLEEKTRGNLTKEEERMLKGTLTGLRMAFVEAVNQGGQTPGSAPAGPAAASPESPRPATSPETAISGEESSGSLDTDSRKKFSKKY
jgi:hypothetical protein